MTFSLLIEERRFLVWILFGRFSARLVPGFFYGFRVVSFIALVEFLIHVNKFRVYKNSYLRSSLKSQQAFGGNSQLSLYLFARRPHFVNTVTLKCCSVYFGFAGVTKYENKAEICSFWIP